MLGICFIFILIKLMIRFWMPEFEAVYASILNLISSVFFLFFTLNIFTKSNLIAKYKYINGGILVWLYGTVFILIFNYLL